MLINDSILQPQEKAAFALRELYNRQGFRPYRMSKFEEYDLYAGNKDFLVSDNVITFTDTDGKLMALKPDVTLSIIKNHADRPERTEKVFYHENVYRVSRGTGSFKELMQAGVECFGHVGTDEIGEVLMLAAESLLIFSDDAVLALSDLDLLSELFSQLRPDAEGQKELWQAFSEKNAAAVERLCASSSKRDEAGLLKRLLALSGKVKDVLPILQALFSGRESEAFGRFEKVLEKLAESPFADLTVVDFSVTGDIHYYNGIVFKGFIRDIPTDLLSGGQYDHLMRRLGRVSSAVGFAVYTDLLERTDLSLAKDKKADDDFLNIALPKGRLGEKIYRLFAEAGYACDDILTESRKLVFENNEKKIRYFWVKPSDVAIYVEHGAADLGVAGKDILEEYAPEVYELVDLHCGNCRMAVAAPDGYRDDPSKTLRVATKFAEVAKSFYRAKGRKIDIIHLNGSIELAPILGLSDVIVDIVETGTTLKENHLSVVETLFPISARLIANQSSFKFKRDAIETLADRLAKLTEETK